MASPKRYLGIDFGTSAVRACVINDSEEIIAASRSAFEDNKNSALQSPAHWIETLKASLAALADKIDLQTVNDICVNGTSGTVLIADSDGNPLTDALMYHDASCMTEADTIRQYAPHPATAITAGLPKAMYLAKQTTQPGIIMHQADWVSGWLSDVYGISDENNALKSGYDLQAQQWSSWARDALPAHIQLPKVYVPGTHIGTASKNAQALGLPATAQVHIGTTDSTAAFLASGVTRLDQGVTTLGSTLVLKQLSKHYIEDSQHGIYSHRLGDIWLVGGASNTGCAVIDQFFNVDEITTLSRHIDSSTDSAFDYYPLIKTGERFPVYDPKLEPRLTPKPERNEDYLKALMQGIAHIERAGYQRLQQSGTTPIKEVITSGGGSRNPVWQAMRQRILGVPVSQAEHSEAAFGTARLAKHSSQFWTQFK